ncbi:MAG TPA: phospholipase D-like domain-containing protein, partial [Bacteroidia bacterium]|nr:phospholipase D-like domain-containing protein [Bacteroidia bacterium]
DGANTKILNTINTANNSLFFGVYTFTETNDANAIVSRQSAGVYTAGILDQYSTSFGAYPILSSAFGTQLQVYSNANFLYHNKFLIVDECDSTSDPLVLTGSHNWSSSADTKNDENTLIVHSQQIANEYYQSFNQDFTTLGGTLSLSCLSTGMNSDLINTSSLDLFPVPAANEIAVKNIFSGKVTIAILDVNGQMIRSVNSSDDLIRSDVSDLPNGMYFITETQNGQMISGKFIINR